MTSLIAGDESANVDEQLKACRNQIALLRARVRDLLDTKRQEREEKQSSKDEAQPVKRRRTTRVDTSVAASSDSLSTTDTLPDSSESDDDQDPCDEPNPSPRECELSALTAWSDDGYHSKTSGDVILAGVKYMFLAPSLAPSDCRASLSTFEADVYAACDEGVMVHTDADEVRELASLDRCMWRETGSVVFDSEVLDRMLLVECVRPELIQLLTNLRVPTAV